MSIHCGGWDYAIRATEGGAIIEIKGEGQPMTSQLAALQAFLENQHHRGIGQEHWPSPLMQFTKARLRLTDWRDLDEE